MLIKVIKSSSEEYWYTDHIGTVFDAKELNNLMYEIPGVGAMLIEDCIMLNANGHDDVVRTMRREIHAATIVSTLKEVREYYDKL